MFQNVPNYLILFFGIFFISVMLAMAVFLPMNSFRAAFDLDAEEFSGYLSNTELTDIDGDYIAAVLTERISPKCATSWITPWAPICCTSRCCASCCPR